MRILPLLASCLVVLLASAALVSPAKGTVQASQTTPASDSPSSDKNNSNKTVKTDAAVPTKASSASNSKEPPRSSSRAVPSKTAVPLVWVNTDSKVYHMPGSKWYGKTRHGKYMTETDARRAGYHPAAKERSSKE